MTRGGPTPSIGWIISVSVHVALLVAGFVFGVFPIGGCASRQHVEEIPFGFLVEPSDDVNPAATPDTQEPPPPAPEPEPEPEPDPVPLPPEPTPKPPEPKPEKPKEPEKKPAKPTIKKSDKIVDRSKPAKTNTPKKPTADDYRRAIGKPPSGVPTGNPNATSANKDATAIAQMTHRLQEAWAPIKPDFATCGARTAELELSLAPNGSFTCRISASSGSREMDDSILNAARGVGRFNFLPAGFSGRRPTVTIEFVLEPPR